MRSGGETGQEGARPGRDVGLPTLAPPPAARRDRRTSQANAVPHGAPGAVVRDGVLGGAYPVGSAASTNAASSPLSFSSEALRTYIMWPAS